MYLVGVEQLCHPRPGLRPSWTVQAGGAQPSPCTSTSSSTSSAAERARAAAPEIQVPLRPSGLSLSFVIRFHQLPTTHRGASRVRPAHGQRQARPCQRYINSDTMPPSRSAARRNASSSTAAAHAKGAARAAAPALAPESATRCFHAAVNTALRTIQERGSLTKVAGTLPQLAQLEAAAQRAPAIALFPPGALDALLTLARSPSATAAESALAVLNSASRGPPTQMLEEDKRALQVLAHGGMVAALVELAAGATQSTAGAAAAAAAGAAVAAAGRCGDLAACRLGRWVHLPSSCLRAPPCARASCLSAAAITCRPRWRRRGALKSRRQARPLAQISMAVPCAVCWTNKLHRWWLAHPGCFRGRRSAWYACRCF
ncbi:MAG: hypothetical protein J3K34DRAFT_399612 [Monoraphidium minutum]|nr:MAG: hypothetical protein J3K34DRAFT_399612 [Monoraphidium minutum]